MLKELSSYSGNDFEKEIKRFAESLDCLLFSLPNVMAIMARELEAANSKLEKLLNEHATEKVVEGNSIKFTISGKAAIGAAKLQRNVTYGHTAYRLIHRSFLTSLVSQYDAYLGRLLGLMYCVQPEKLNSSEKQITFKELVQFSSLEEARERLIEREVDAVIRRSHEDQFAWVKDNLSINAVAFIPELHGFIEIAQRRHLFVHCDGVVSTQYIKNCKSAGVKLASDIVVGHQLEVSKEYLESSFETVYAVGAKTGVAVWLQLFKSDVDKAASCINHLCFELINNSRYSLAINLLEYAIGGKQKPTQEQNVRFIVLNLAQAYRWSGDLAKCTSCLAAYDWSASSDVIRIGVAVLRDEYEEAIRLVRKLRHDDAFKKDYYREWPIFREFRKLPDFLRLYRDLYSEEFEQTTVLSTEKEHPSD